MAAPAERFRRRAPVFDERARRLAAEAAASRRVGMARVARATGVSLEVIGAGIAELATGERLPAGRVRRPGGGRKRTADTDPTLWPDSERLVDPVTRGDRESPLLWAAKNLRTLAAELGRLGHRVSHRLGRRSLARGGLQPAGPPQDAGGR